MQVNNYKEKVISFFKRLFGKRKKSRKPIEIELTATPFSSAPYTSIVKYAKEIKEVK